MKNKKYPVINRRDKIPVRICADMKVGEIYLKPEEYEYYRNFDFLVHFSPVTFLP